jgi:hypothetical protein
MSDWVFADAPDVAVLTTQPVLDGQQPILFVSHDVEDGLWQFLEGEAIDETTVLHVALAELVARDPALVELARLPLGWQARRRELDAPWSMYPRCC